MSSLDRLRFARAYAAQQLPWFAPALFRARMIISPAVAVAAVDRHYNIYWNPEVVDRIWEGQPRVGALSELAFLWVHEISHLLRDHAGRAVGGPHRWNVACDLEVNDSEWEGLRMPSDYPGHHPDGIGLPTGLLAEDYLRLLNVPGQRQPDRDIDEGSGVHGQPRPWEVGEDRQRLAPADEEIIRREVARRTREAAAGEIPEGWRVWAAEVIAGRTNWRQVLGNRLSVALRRGMGSRTDYSYARPSRRQTVYHPVVVPVLTGGRTARVAIVVDTSGSMSEADLVRVLGEVAAVVAQFRYPVTIIPCDIQAYEPVRLVAAREAFTMTKLPGGSGTHLIAGIRAAVELRPLPDVVLVLTDGQTDYPTETYAVPVVIGLLATPGAPAPPRPPDPPFSGDRVVLI